jgi:thioredoxin 1
MYTSNRFRITAIPTLLVFKNGQLIDKLVGAYPKAALYSKIKKYL